MIAFYSMAAMLFPFPEFCFVNLDDDSRFTDYLIFFAQRGCRQVSEMSEEIALGVGVVLG